MQFATRVDLGFTMPARSCFMFWIRAVFPDQAKIHIKLFLDFPSEILKICPIYFDCQKIEQKNRIEHFSECHFHFLGSHFGAI